MAQIFVSRNIPKLFNFYSWVINWTILSEGRFLNWKVVFDLMDISVVNSNAICKVLYPKGMELLYFEIVLAKSLIGTYNNRCSQ